jgi:mono/diheme cytochrome c family protein
VQGQGSGRMPGYGSTLTDDQIRAIVNYVRGEL